ncbi:MAG: histidine kinase [Clostridiales bacterium]|nr:histidine kinase [Clostridiales bacterium]
MQVRRLSLRSRMLMFSAVCAVAALVAQGALFLRSSSAIIWQQAEEISVSALNKLQEELYTFHKGIENSLIQLYNQERLILDLAELGADGDLALLKESHGQTAFDLAHKAFVPLQNVTSLYIYAGSGQLFSYYRHAQTPKYSYPEDALAALEPDRREMITDYVASSERVMLLTSVSNESREVTLIRYVLKLYDGNSCVGFAICDVDPKPFSRMIEKSMYSEGQAIWLQPDGDRPALMLGGPDESQLPMFEAASLSIKSKEGLSGGLLKGRDYALHSAVGQKYNMSVYSLVPRSALEMNQQALLSNSLVAAAVIALSCVAMFAVLSATLTKPLTYMVRTMNAIKNGDIGLRMKEMGNDEIGELAAEFNEMLDNAALLLKREYDARLLANDARYKALQAQVNPHFLYNTLEAMSGIAASQGCPDVVTLCRALSNIFRYSLNFGAPLASLSEEILHLKNYMYVMNARTLGSVQLDITADPALLKSQMPRLSIQPLVENAIHPGFRIKSEGAKKVAITAILSCGKLAISVEDNGAGMDADAINAELSLQAADAPPQGSIGLRNINARIKLLYGNEYGVAVESESGKGSKVTLTIPAIDQTI